MPVTGSNKARRSSPESTTTPDAIDGQTGLGDIGGQHHFARARGSRGQRRILLLGSQLTVQGQDACAGGQRTVLQLRLYATDFARPRQEHQHVARFLGQSPAHDARGKRLERLTVWHKRPGQERRGAAGIAAFATGRLRPIDCTTGALPSFVAMASPSSVADITSSFRSGARFAWAGRG